MRVIASQRKTLGRKPDPTFDEVQANPRHAKAVRALRREFQSQNHD
jgi:hypothetical protein